MRGEQRRGGARFVMWLLAIAAVGLLVRVYYVEVVVLDHLPLGGDRIAYSSGANLFVGGRGFIQPLSVLKPAQTASHPPLYTLWLSIASALDPSAWTTQTVHLFWSCVLGTATIILIGFAGREIFGRRCGIAAAALAALYPGLWIYDGALLSETMAMFTTVGVLLFAYRFAHRPTLARAAWLGLWCGLAALSRSELVLTVVFVLVPLALLARECAWRARLVRLGAGVVAALIVISPWVLYNRGRFDEPPTLSTNFGQTIAAANCDATYSGPYLGFKSYSCLSDAGKRVVTSSMDESEQDVALRSDTEQYIRRHAGRLPQVVLARWGRASGLYKPWQEATLMGYDRTFGHSAVELQLWSFYPMALLAIAGAVILRRRRVLLFPLLAIPVIVLISVASTFGQLRYRAPAEPVFVLLAAVTLVELARWFGERRQVSEVPDPDASEPSETELAAL